MTPLTAASARHGALEPSLDAIAHNHNQARLIDSPDTPQADSVVECLDVAMRHLRHAMHIMGNLARSNGLELNSEQVIAGWGDDLVTTLRHEELNGDGIESGRRLAARLKALLDSVEPAEGVAHIFDAVDARVDLVAIFRATPRSVLLADAVTKQLAPRRTRLLEAEYDRWCERVGKNGVAA